MKCPRCGEQWFDADEETCTHVNAFERTVETPNILFGWLNRDTFICRICDDCGAWLSLGPAASADPDELQLAELLADVAHLWEPGPARDEREGDLVRIMAGSGPALARVP